jgi:catechol 2,3-dioxygenase-like lactoylglutathione lyase family enzyme
MAVQMGHVGLCVSDLDRSLRFYTEGLGFEVQERRPGGDVFAALAEVEPPVQLLAQFVVKDSTRLELLAWPQPGVHGKPSQTRNQLGLTHLCFQVDDIEAVETRLVALGGTLMEETRTKLRDGSEFDGSEFVVVQDPDGTRIELLQRA